MEHRCVGAAEHDPSKSAFHGCCRVCITPWPCEYAGKPPPDPELAARLARIDETARLRFIQLLAWHGTTAAVEQAYTDAIALERARDEAVKEIQ